MKQVGNLLGLIALAAAAHANAGCMDNIRSLLHQGSPARSVPPAAPSSQMTPAVYRPDAMRGAGFVPVADWGNGRDAIVGLWQFQFSGFSVDWGTQAWHADGTELMFSVGQNPQTGDVCQGVWQQIGPRTYTLNHVAMGWAAPGADPTKGSEFLRVHFHVSVTLDPNGEKFTGKYSVSVYMESASNPFNEDPKSNPPIASGTGSVTATRINPDPGP
jgi:hypothetical protein